MAELRETSLREPPIASPPVVHQAVGMIMEYLNCTAASAYGVLTERSVATGQCVVSVALDVVERRLCFGNRKAERDRFD